MDVLSPCFVWPPVGASSRDIGRGGGFRRGRSQTGPSMAGDFPVYGGRDKSLPYKITGTLPNLRRGGPWASRQDSHRERWFGKTRRKNSTASVPIFANPGPSGPAGIQSATQILRAESALPGPRGNPRNGPRNGVRGKATMSTKCSSELSPVAFWFLCRHGQRNSPPAGGEIPCGKP